MAQKRVLSSFPLQQLVDDINYYIRDLHGFSNGGKICPQIRLKSSPGGISNYIISACVYTHRSMIDIAELDTSEQCSIWIKRHDLEYLNDNNTKKRKL